MLSKFKMEEIQLKMSISILLQFACEYFHFLNCPVTHLSQWEDLQATRISRSQIKGRNVKTETGTAHYYDTAISHVDV